jgi:hypothetical protein
MITGYIPDSYRWLLFIAGEALILASVTIILIRSSKYPREHKVR